MKRYVSSLLAGACLLGCAHRESPTIAKPPSATAPIAAAQDGTVPLAKIDVAITVDDLPVHGPLLRGMTRLSLAQSLLAVFQAHRVPSVYGFINGKKVEEEPETLEVLKAWVAAGHPLANHSWSHPNLKATSLDVFVTDVRKNESLLSSLIPAPSAWHYFRYPFLNEGDTLEKRNGFRQFISENGYTIAEVSIDGNDWAFNGPFARCSERNDEHELTVLRDEFVAVHVDELHRMRELGRRLMKREIAHVVLLHSGIASAAALDSLLTAYEHEGARWVDLPSALSDQFYAIDPALPSDAGPAFPYQVAKARGISVAEPLYARRLEERLNDVCR